MFDTYEKLKMDLPWSGIILDIIKNDSYLEKYTSLEGGGAVLTSNREWYIYYVSKDDLYEIIEYIKKFNGCYRLIMFSKNIFEIKDIIKNYKYHIEHFMRYTSPSISESNIDTDYKYDISEIAELEMKYSKEEISWKYCHKSMEELKDRYVIQLEQNRVFLMGKTLHSKCEIVHQYNDEVFLGKVFTLKEYRNKGYGTKVLKKAINWANLNKYNVNLTVRRENISAYNLYVKNGFSVIGQVIYMILDGGNK